MDDRDEFIFHWRDGSVSRGKGAEAADALNRLGFGNGALPALDYWEKVEKPAAGEAA